MSVLDIYQFPEKVLLKKAEPVSEMNPSLEKLIQDMMETMYHAPGIGLAANQVGVLKRLAVLDLSSQDEPRNTIVIVNPKIVSMSEQTETIEEGCLSVPGFVAEVERAAQVTVAGKNMKGEDIEITAKGLFARALQHEIDHLDGILYIDRIGKLKRQRYVKQRKKELSLQQKTDD